MRINEIIIESQELEEGWKQKLAGAALAGAAAFGGGGANDANAQMLNLPDAVWQQADKALGLPGKTNTQKVDQRANIDHIMAGRSYVNNYEELYKNVSTYAKKIKQNPESLESVKHNYNKFKKTYDDLDKWYSKNSSLINSGIDRTDKQLVSMSKTNIIASMAELNKFIEKNTPVGPNGREIETISIAGIGEYTGETDAKGEPWGHGTFTTKFGAKYTGTWKGDVGKVKVETGSGVQTGTYDMFKGFTPSKK